MKFKLGPLSIKAIEPDKIACRYFTAYVKYKDFVITTINYYICPNGYPTEYGIVLRSRRIDYLFCRHQLSIDF